MANSMNKVILMGRLGQSPKVRVLEGGNAMSNFSVATGEKFKDKSGEWKEQTEWHNCVAFGNTAQFVNTYIGKGARVLIEGKIQYREWLDKEQVKQKMTQIIVERVISLDKREVNSAPTNEEATYHAEQTIPDAGISDDQDTVPF